MRRNGLLCILTTSALTVLPAVVRAEDEQPRITAPPAHVQVDPFYTKYLDCHGISIVSSHRVADVALREVAHLIEKSLEQRPEVLEAMGKAGVRFVVIHSNEAVTDIPEHSRMRPKQFWNLRARGFGGQPVSCGEENLLNLPGDRYATESIFVHEFAHCIDGTMRGLDETFRSRLRATFDAAKKKGLWKDTYAGTTPGEYFAEGVQSWFETNRTNDSLHNHVDTREELKEYDPALAALIEEACGDGEWRYRRYDLRTQGRAASLRLARFYFDQEFAADQRPRFIRAGDLDGNGKPDLVAGGDGVLFAYRAKGRRVAEWKRFGNLDASRSIGAGAAVLRDVDGDGDLDIVSAKRRGDVGWWENPEATWAEDSTWTFHSIAPSELELRELVEADIDGDGAKDELVAALVDPESERLTVCWLEASAGGASSRHSIGSPGVEDGGRGLDVGDVDRDGHVDIAFAGAWYEAPDDPTAAWKRHPVGRIDGASHAKLRDLDSDGDLDLVVAAGAGGDSIVWFECPNDDPLGEWPRHQIAVGILLPRGLAVADIDRDGDLDVLTCEYDSSRKDQQAHRVIVFENRRERTTSRWRRIDVSGASYPCVDLGIADIDGDGKPDVFGVGANRGVLSFYQNVSPVPDR